MHPAAEDDVIEPDFDWDVVLDEQVRKQVGDRSGFLSPVGALLEHELLGHFMRCYSERVFRPSMKSAAPRSP